MSPPIQFDPRSQRYRFTDTGTYASASAVRNLVSSAIDAVQKELIDTGEAFLDGKLLLGEWETRSAGLVKKIHLWSYLLGTGGKSGLTSQDYGIVGNRLRKEYEYLRGFSRDVADAKVSVAQFRHRLKMYAEAASGSYERARQESHKRSGFFFERRLRTKTESCQSCFWYAAQGWQPIGTLPAPTVACECRSNCGCYKQYAKTNPTIQLLNSDEDSWLLSPNSRKPLSLLGSQPPSKSRHLIDTSPWD